MVDEKKNSTERIESSLERIEALVRDGVISITREIKERENDYQKAVKSAFERGYSEGFSSGTVKGLYGPY